MSDPTKITVEAGCLSVVMRIPPCPADMSYNGHELPGRDPSLTPAEARALATQLQDAAWDVEMQAEFARAGYVVRPR